MSVDDSLNSAALTLPIIHLKRKKKKGAINFFKMQWIKCVMNTQVYACNQATSHLRSPVLVEILCSVLKNMCNIALNYRCKVS